jgi:hypothetical protein
MNLNEQMSAVFAMFTFVETLQTYIGVSALSTVIERRKYMHTTVIATVTSIATVLQSEMLLRIIVRSISFSIKDGRRKFCKEVPARWTLIGIFSVATVDDLLEPAWHRTRKLW